MFKYEYKEKTYAEEILKNGFTSNNIRHELKILVKYFKDLGHKPKERKELLYKFCEKNLEGYNRVTHFKMINSVLNYGNNKKNKLIQIDNVNVTSEELQYIDNLNVDYEYKKVVFTLLVLNKLNKIYNEIRDGMKVNKEHYFSGDANYKKLTSSSRVSLKKNKNIHSIIGYLAREGILETVNRGSIKLSFVYEIPESDSSVMIIITFDNIGLYYGLHTEEKKVKECECCETPIKVSGNKKKYCDECAQEVKKKQNRIADVKYKNKIRDDEKIEKR